MNLRIKLLTCLGCWLVFSSFIGTIKQKPTIQHAPSVSSRELYDRGFALINEDVRRADSLITTAWKMARLDHDALGIANGYFYKGCVFDRKMMLDSAISSLEKSIELYILEDAWSNVPDAYGRIGLLKFKKNRIQEGLEYLMKGIKVAEANNNPASIVRLSIVLAMHHNDYTSHYHEAISYLAKAEQSAKKLKDNNLLGHIYLQYSVSYQQLNTLDKAESYAKKSIKFFQDVNSTYNEMRALYTLGSVYGRERKSDQLLEILAEVQPMLLRNPDDLLQANYDKLYAEAVYIKGKYTEALSYADRAAQLLEVGGQTQGVIDLNRLKFRIYYALGNVAKADSLYYQTEAILDSTFSERTYSIDADLRQKYDVEAKQAKIKLQDLQIQHGVNLRYGLLGLLILLGALAITAYRKYLVKKRLNELNELLLNEVNHRVKNNLQLLSSIFSIQNRKLESQEAKDLITKCMTRMRTFTVIQDMLYMQKSKESIDMKSFLSQLCDGNETSNGEQVYVQIEAEDLKLNVDFAMHIGLIINELVTNTYKYAFNEKPVGQSLSTYEDVMVALEDPSRLHEIKISLKQAGANALDILYGDNGPGIPNGINLSTQKSMGMKLIFGLARQMQGAVDYNREKNQFLIHLKSKV